MFFFINSVNAAPPRCDDIVAERDRFVSECLGDNENSEDQDAELANCQIQFTVDNPSSNIEFSNCNRLKTLESECKGTLTVNDVDSNTTDPTQEVTAPQFNCQCEGANGSPAIGMSGGKFACDRQIASKNKEGEGQDTGASPGKDDGGGSSKDEDKDKDKDEDDEKSPFECAGGGGGGNAGQAAQQQLQKRAEMENRCNETFEQARVKCDPDSVVGVDGLIAEANAKAERAKTAGESGLKQACDEYNKAMQAASSELKSFRNQCASQKANCISTCNQAVAENAATNPILQLVAQCAPMFGAIMSAMSASSGQIKQVNLRGCTEFESTLKTADDKHKELVSLMRDSDLCQSQMQESCTRNSTAAHCRSLETVSRDPSELGDVDTAIPRDKDFSLNTNPLGGGANIAATDLKGKGANVKQANGATSAKLGSAGGGGNGSGAQRGGGGFYSEYDDLYNRTKGDSFNKAPRGGSRRGGRSYAGYKGRKYKGKGKTKARGKSGLDLKKYLPGGSRDPSRYQHGITPANGPDIFDKVSNRYRIKKGSLLNR